MGRDYLEALQDWYHSNVDGDWEHSYGINIHNVDNPGWRVSIPIEETPVEGKPFEAVRWKNGDDDWLYCRVSDGHFIGDGGSRNLVDMIRIFIDWVDVSQSGTA